MSISKDSFTEKVKKIYDRWYFQYDRDGNLCLMEKPYIRHYKGEKDWVVDWYVPGTIFTEKIIKKLKWMHSVRLQGLQKEVISNIAGRNKMRKMASSRKFHRANREIFGHIKKQMKKEASDSGISRTAIRKNMKGVLWDDTKKVINKTFEYAEKHAAGSAQANHPHIILEQERKFAAGEQKRLVPA